MWRSSPGQKVWTRAEWQEKRCCLIRKLHPHLVTACIENPSPLFRDHAFVISCVANLIIVLRSFISNLLRSRDMEGNAGGGGIDDICSGGAVVLLPSPRSRSPPLFQLCHLCRLNTACASGPSPLAASTSEHICRAALLNERTNPLTVPSLTSKEETLHFLQCDPFVLTAH